MRILSLAAIITNLVLSTVSAMAQTWSASVDANVTLTQNANTDNWVGGEIGSMSWTFLSNSLAEKQLHSKVHNKNTLKLQFGQNHMQDKNTKDWGKPVKSNDLIDFESVFRFSLGGYVDPYASGRIESQFIDKRDLLKKKRPIGPPPSGKGTKPGWPLGHRIAFILFLVILGLFLWKQMNPENANQIKISYTEFSKLLSDDKIKTVKIHNNTLDGELKESMNLDKKDPKRSSQNITVNIGSYDQEFVQDLVDRKIEVTIVPEKTWMNMMISKIGRYLLN